MAITANKLTNGSISWDVQPYVTASVTPGANKLQLLAVFTAVQPSSTPVPGPTTVTGCGLTWVQVAKKDFWPDSAGDVVNLHGQVAVYRAMGAAPTAGALTINYPGDVATCNWSLVEFDGVDTSGTNGSGAIVQSGGNTNGATWPTSGISIILSALGDPANATYGAFGSAWDNAASAPVVISPGSGYTLQHNGGEQWGWYETQFKSAGSSTVNATVSGASEAMGGVAIEIKSATTTPVTSPKFRSPYKQPFAPTSIWNMPIGSGAVYVPANMGQPVDPTSAFDTDWATLPGGDRDNIVLSPASPMRAVNYSDAGWGGGDRCTATGGLLTTVPIPDAYICPNGPANNSAAFLMPDYRTIEQVQPLARCTAAGTATSIIRFAIQDIYGSGITGAHGGSNLSAIGGTIRLGELVPGQKGPTHALKCTIYAAQFLYKGATYGDCYRWPAVTADSAWARYGSNSNATNNSNPNMKMGALLAIAASVDLNSLGLETEPAKQLAWTLQNYGAYIVDDSYGPAFLWCTEDGAAGKMETEFQANYGFPFEQRFRDNTPWTRDQVKLFQALSCVANNSPTSIGGGGTPRQPLALPFSGSFKNEAHDFNNAATSLTINKPASTVAGDFMLASISAQGSATITMPSGWTLINSVTTGATATDTKQSTYYKFAGAGEGASFTWTFSVSTPCNGHIWSVKDIDPTTPISNKSTASGTSKTPTAATITPTNNNTLLCLMMANRTAATTWSTPAFWDNRNPLTSGPTIKTLSLSASLYDKAATGAIATATNGLVGDKWTAQLVALNPNTSSNVTSALTGNISVGAVGSVSIPGSPGLTGNISYGSVGSLLTAAGVSLSGNISYGVVGSVSKTASAATSFRNPYKQPFAATSIWNTPIGSGAVFVAANLPTTFNSGNTTDDTWAPFPQIDEEILITDPTAPATAINYSSAGWSGTSRCAATGGLLTTVPMPSSYVLPSTPGNASSAILMADWRTIEQVQPLTRCVAGGPATAYVRFPTNDLYGDGITGSHGGSGLSAIGGSIRLGELRPGQVGMKHALKVNVYAKAALFKGTTYDQCYRWPAIGADGYAVGRYGVENNNSNVNMKMGSLLAIPPGVNIDNLGLETTPAKQLAWTLQNYGAYIVDDTWGPAFALNAEIGPNGTKADEFQADWGFPLQQRLIDASPWTRDMQRLVASLYCVSNNAPNAVGGGGIPRQPLADDFSAKWRSEAHNFNNATTSLAINVPAGVANGDFLLASFACTGDVTVTPPAGWTLIQKTSSGTSSADSQQNTYWRAASSEPASYSWGVSASTACNGFIWRITGVDTSQPINVTSSVSGTGTTVNAAAVSPSVNNTLLCLLTTSKSTASSWPMPNFWSSNNGAGSGSNVQAAGGTASYYDKASTGTLTTYTNGTGTDKWTAQVIAIVGGSSSGGTVPSGGVNAYKLTSGMGNMWEVNKTYTTASVTPTANRLQLLSVVTMRNAVGVPLSPTITGCGLTWVPVNNQSYWNDSGNLFSNITVYRAMGAAPTAGTLTITSVDDLAGAAWSLTEFDGVDQTGTNGSGAIVQSGTNFANGGFNQCPVTLGPFSSPTNATYGALGSASETPTSAPVSISPGVGFNALHNIGQGYCYVGSEWRPDNSQMVAMTTDKLTFGMAMIGIEIKASTASKIMALTGNISYGAVGSLGIRWLLSVIGQSKTTGAMKKALMKKFKSSNAASVTKAKKGLPKVQKTTNSVSVAKANKARGRFVKAMSTAASFALRIGGRVLKATPSKALLSVKKAYGKKLPKAVSTTLSRIIKPSQRVISATSATVAQTFKQGSKLFQVFLGGSAVFTKKALSKRLFTSEQATAGRRADARRAIRAIATSSAAEYKTLKRLFKTTSNNVATSRKRATRLLKSVVGNFTRLQMKNVRLMVLIYSQRAAVGIRRGIVVRKFASVGSVVPVTRRFLRRLLATANVTVSRMARQSKVVRSAISVVPVSFHRSLRVTKWVPSISAIKISRTFTVSKRAIASASLYVRKAFTVTKKLQQSNTSRQQKGIAVSKRAYLLSSSATRKKISVTKASVAEVVQAMFKRFGTRKTTATQATTATYQRAALLRRRATTSTAARIRKGIATRLSVAISSTAGTLVRSIKVIKFTTGTAASRINRTVVRRVRAIAVSLAVKQIQFSRKLITASIVLRRLTRTAGKVPRAVVGNVASFGSRAFVKMMAALSISSVLSTFISTLKSSTTVRQFIVVAQRIRNIKIR